MEGEDEALRVEGLLDAGGCCGTANWSEVAQKVRAHGRNWDLARALLISFGLTTDVVTLDDVEWAARRWRPGEGLSLALRLCLSLGERLDADVWTADQTWGAAGRILRQMR